MDDLRFTLESRNENRISAYNAKIAASHNWSADSTESLYNGLYKTGGFAAGGAAAGGIFGGPAGAAIGGVCGALVGYLLS